MSSNDIYLFNTLSRSKELFKPIKKVGWLGKVLNQKHEVSMYNCGPTVYDYAHIGNLRTYVFSDILRRVLEYNDLKVHQVINVTDVGHLVSDGDDGEDKMTKALKRENKPLTLAAMNEVGSYYLEKFLEDIRALNIELPRELPKASEHIAEDIEIISKLEEKKYAYRTSDGIYFDTSKFSDYGKLGNISLKNLKEGVRVTTNSGKKNPIDFCLWKFDPKLGWESPWGKGFPGWHIECSGMSRKYLGQPFDIHTGGIDHIPVHHNNEIAQSEAAFGVPLAYYWLHGEHLTVDSGKIAKSAGNSIVLNTIRENNISPLAFRYWLLTSHYRTQVNFTYDAVRAGQNALNRLILILSSYGEGGHSNLEYTARFVTLINDDLDMPKALALVWDLIKDVKISDADKRATIINFDKVFGLDLAATLATSKLKTEEKVFSNESISAEIKALADAREAARKNKDWQKADELRKKIKQAGYDIEDKDVGYILKKI